MTSWIQVPLPKKNVEKNAYFVQTNDAGFCSNFNQFLYAYAFSKSHSRSLEVYDMGNAVSVNFPLIRNTFGDISGVTYRDSASASATPIRRTTLQAYIQSDYVNKTQTDTLRSIAQRIFHWSPSLIPTLKGILSSANLPVEFDLGIHIRVGDKITTKPVPVDTYIRAVKSFQASSKKDAMNLFLMSDSLNVISEFKKKSDPSWKVYTLPSALPSPDGHVQGQFNRAPARARLAAYNTFMAELVIMQSITNLVCTLSSNVGRFLYYTVEHPENIVSLDEKFTVK